MTTLATLACIVTATGISRPSYADIYETLQANFRSIYGHDAYIDPDSQDGQLLAVVAKAIDDTNGTAVAVYNSYSPATAQGVALSNGVKINGIARAIATSSQALVRVIGAVGTVITNGVAGDTSDNRWLLPASVTIPPAGQIDVTATAEAPGSIEAEAGVITQILTPTLGWQTVSNLAAASPGAPVESDAALRQRQTDSVALPSLTVLASLTGAVAAVPGVTQVRVFENDTDDVDANGLPMHSIAVVVLGGVADAIAAAILTKKTPGAATHGTTAVSVVDPIGIPYTIRYFIPADVVIKVAVTIRTLAGYTAAVGEEIKTSLAAYINALGIGKRIDLGRLYLPAQFFGSADSSTFEVNTLAIAVDPGVPAAADIEIPFNSRATCDTADITLTLT
jgi:uncharacterized phage protein gp47/JayE